MPYLGPGIDNGYRSRFIYTATAGQTSFSGGDANGITLTYTDSEYLDVYQNGVLLVPGDDYAATTGTTVVLVQGASLNDKVEMIQYQAFGVADTVSRADGGAFGGNISTSGTLAVTGNTTVGGTLGVTGIATFTDDIIIGNGKTIGSASDVDAMTISSGGAVTFSQNTVGAGDMVLLSTITASTDAEIDFNGLFTSAYRDYELIGSNIHTSADNVSVGVRVLIANGIKSDSHYRYTRIRNYSGDATVRGAAEQTDTEFAKVAGYGVGNAAGEHANFRMMIFNPLGTDNFKTIETKASSVDPSGDHFHLHGSGHYKNGVAALTGIRFFVASGTIATGTFKLYGRQ
jgi:hypothetical protein